MVDWCSERLLQHRPDLDGTDQRRDTALHLAAGAGNTLVCRALLDRGATVTARVRRAPGSLVVLFYLFIYLFICTTHNRSQPHYSEYRRFLYASLLG